MRTSKNQLIIDYLSETDAENDLKGILIDIFNHLDDSNSNIDLVIDSVINKQLSSKSINEDNLNTMLTEFENKLDKDYNDYKNNYNDYKNKVKANVSSNVKVVSNKDTNKHDVEVASINSSSNITSKSNNTTTSNNTSNLEIKAKPTEVTVNAVIDRLETKKNIANAITIANPLEEEQENKIAHDYPIQKVNITWYPAKCWADAVIRMLYSAPSSRKFFIKYEGDNATFQKISEIFKMMHNKDNKNNTDRYELSRDTITYNKIKNVDSDIEGELGFLPNDYSEQTLGEKYDIVNDIRLTAEKDAPSYEFCYDETAAGWTDQNNNRHTYEKNDIQKYTTFHDPADFYSYIMNNIDEEFQQYFSFTHSIDAKCNENNNIIKYNTHINNIIGLDNLGDESSIKKKINEFLDIKPTSFPLNYNKIVGIINNPNNGDKNEMLINDTNKITEAESNEEIFKFYTLKGMKINKEEIFYKYDKYFMKKHSGESNDFFKDVYEFGAMSRHSKCDGITNHIEYEQDKLEFTDQNKYIVIFVQRRDSDNTNSILQNTIIPDKKISISDTPYTLTGIISLRGRDHYIYYECNDKGNVIRVYDDKHPYIDLNENDIINSHAEVHDKFSMNNIYINGLKHTEHINTHGCMFLYSRYPVDQYNTEETYNELIEQLNEKLLKRHKYLRHKNKIVNRYNITNESYMNQLVTFNDVYGKLKNNTASPEEVKKYKNSKYIEDIINKTKNSINNTNDAKKATEKEIANIEKEIENIEKEIENIEK